MLLNIPGIQGTDAHNKDLFIQNADIAEVEKSCSRERAGGSEVEGPLESIYKVRVRMDVRERLKLLRNSQRAGTAQKPSVSVRLPGLLNLAVNAMGGLCAGAHQRKWWAVWGTEIPSQGGTRGLSPGSLL